MPRQGAATPGPTYRVSVGGVPSLRLPRQPHSAPLILLQENERGEPLPRCLSNSCKGEPLAPPYLSTVSGPETVWRWGEASSQRRKI